MVIELHELPGSERPSPVGMQQTGPVDRDEPVTVSIYLHPPTGREDPSALGATFTDRATLRAQRSQDHADDFAQIASFAEQAGLTLVETDPARRLARLSGPAAAFEAAFETRLHRYEGHGQACRARTGKLHLPELLVDRVAAVLGLDTRAVATPKIVPHRGPMPPAGFLPTDIARLYGFDNAQASGQCVGIIELGGGYTDDDNRTAFGAMGLPVPDIVAVGVDGAQNNPADTSGANGEVALDIQVVGGVAPGARIVVYFAPNTSQGFADAISQAVHDEVNKPSAISISWGSAEQGWSGQALAAMSQAFADAATLGVTVTAASGDSLATDGVVDGKPHVDYPASDPNVLGCGGTRITADAEAITGETVWKSNGGGTGGGVSTLFAKPAYQTKANVPEPGTRKGGRGVPDVAGDADPDSGYRIVTAGQTGIIGGTSAVAPLWAGIAAVLNAKRANPVGLLQPQLYANTDALDDVVSGDNKSDAIGYSAAQGWDPCTGLGSPDGAQLRRLFGTPMHRSAPASDMANAGASLFRLTTLDGSTILVASGSIFRVRAAMPSEGGAATHVDYGDDFLLTHEAVDALLARIGSAGRFVAFETRGGTTVHLNTTAISSVRASLPPDGAGTDITVGGQLQQVVEDLPAVEAMLS
jgi:kumamolisin